MNELIRAGTMKLENGHSYVVLEEVEYLRLLDLAEEADDVRRLEEVDRKLVSGEEELVSAEIVDRLLAGENCIRVWREHRGLTLRALAERAGVSAGYLSELESGRKDGTVRTLKAIAEALRVDLDDLA